MLCSSVEIWSSVGIVFLWYQVGGLDSRRKLKIVQLIGHNLVDLHIAVIDALHTQKGSDSGFDDDSIQVDPHLVAVGNLIGVEIEQELQIIPVGFDDHGRHRFLLLAAGPFWRKGRDDLQLGKAEVLATGCAGGLEIGECLLGIRKDSIVHRRAEVAKGGIVQVECVHGVPIVSVLLVVLNATSEVFFKIHEELFKLIDVLRITMMVATVLIDHSDRNVPVLGGSVVDDVVRELHFCHVFRLIGVCALGQFKRLKLRTLPSVVVVADRHDSAVWNVVEFHVCVSFCVRGRCFLPHARRVVQSSPPWSRSQRSSMRVSYRRS